ncbi:hypothetical protein CALCODRAFT_511477 [Calocera cornea HHB12733]|uniref:Uncharacterized protein n=1 Tax=Calocera cornea HHB12733 TaxID=1353952 RepID=A0A165DQT5_9BASI|nr:hypothetical protein CALCODRAFT_511477 [Calocera cornea HHB12733]
MPEYYIRPECITGESPAARWSVFLPPILRPDFVKILRSIKGVDGTAGVTAHAGNLSISAVNAASSVYAQCTMGAPFSNHNSTTANSSLDNAGGMLKGCLRLEDLTTQLLGHKVNRRRGGVGLLLQPPHHTPGHFPFTWGKSQDTSMMTSIYNDQGDLEINGLVLSSWHLAKPALTVHTSSHPRIYIRPTDVKHISAAMGITHPGVCNILERSSLLQI